MVEISFEKWDRDMKKYHEIVESQRKTARSTIERLVGYVRELHEHPDRTYIVELAEGELNLFRPLNF